MPPQAGDTGEVFPSLGRVIGGVFTRRLGLVIGSTRIMFCKFRLGSGSGRTRY
jgi:hypothetical protein